MVEESSWYVQTHEILQKNHYFFLLCLFFWWGILNFRAYHIEYYTNISQIKPSGEKKIFLSLLLLFPQRCSKKAQNWSKGVLRARNPWSDFFFFGKMIFSSIPFTKANVVRSQKILTKNDSGYSMYIWLSFNYATLNPILLSLVS